MITISRKIDVISWTIRKKRFECHAALRSLFILLLRSLPAVLEKNLFIILYYVNYAMVMSKRSKISFQRYVHDAMIMKNIRFTYVS